MAVESTSSAQTPPRPMDESDADANGEPDVDADGDPDADGEADVDADADADADPDFMDETVPMVIDPPVRQPPTAGSSRFSSKVSFLL